MPLPSSSLALNLALIPLREDQTQHVVRWGLRLKQRQEGRQCQVRTANTYTSPPGEHTVSGQEGREWRRRGGRLNQSLRRSPAVVSMTVARRGVATDNKPHRGNRVKNKESNQEWREEPGSMCWRLWLLNNTNKHAGDEEDAEKILSRCLVEWKQQ